MPDYKELADAVAADIHAGRLRPGDQLPPQRVFAYERSIAISTASRVYSDLVRRGLAIGETGRGTFIRAPNLDAGFAAADPEAIRVDLALNAPLLPRQSPLMAASLAAMLKRPAILEAAMAPMPVQGTRAARETFAPFLTRSGWSPSPDAVLFAGNGKQAIAAALSALVSPGERLGVEAMTFPAVKGIAECLGIDLVPLEMDAHGLLPQALARAARRSKLRAVYCQPTLHNPLGMTMPKRRRMELASVLHEQELLCIEDAIYAFLSGDVVPLAAHAPSRTILIDSLSKRLAPGLTLGLIAAPSPHVHAIARALRAGAWGPSGFALEACSRWVSEGLVAKITLEKRRDAVARQTIARKALSGLSMQSDPNAYHCWLILPQPWRAEAFVAAAAARGIAVLPAAAFSAAPGHAPNAVRLALASPSRKALKHSLGELAALALNK